MALLGKKPPRRNTQNGYTVQRAPVSKNTRLHERQQEASRTSVQKERPSVMVDKQAFTRTVWWFASSLLAVACMVLLAFGFLSLTNYVMTHPYFTIQTINVEGAQRFSKEEVIQLAGVEENTNAFGVSLQEIQARLLQNPWVESAEIIRVLPSTLNINITERVPRFFVVQNNRLCYLDDHARIIAPVENTKFVSLPTLDIGQGAEEALTVLPDFLDELELSRLPFDLQSISWLHLSAGKGFEMYWENKKLTLSVGIENWKQNLENIMLVIKDLEKRNELADIVEIRADNDQAWLIKK